jgi:thymidylate kinase
MKTVALIGPDGAGKSTIAREVVRALGSRARYLYMGVNLESSGTMLPTTRLALAFKRTRGRGPRMTADWNSAGASGRGASRLLRGGYGAVRLVAWLAEEWYRALLAAIYTWRGYLVVFDRHFVYDYWTSHVLRRPGRPLAVRLHGLMLRRLYPRPDFVICLDAPAEQLHERKQDQSVEWLASRRRDYLGLRTVARDFAVVDATQPVPAVVDQIAGMIQARLA